MTYSEDFDDQDLDDLDDLREATFEAEQRPPSSQPPSNQPPSNQQRSSRPRSGPIPSRSEARGRASTHDARPYTQRSRPDSRSSERAYSQRTYTSASSYAGNNGGGYTVADSSTSKTRFPASLIVLAVVSLISFFVGFITRNTVDNAGLYDDERIVLFEDIPTLFRDFCVSYNGYASFTVVEITSISTLTMSSVPVLKLDTCTIPVNQTANALQALGVQRRSNTIGPQLGGSNLTLVSMPFAYNLARELYNDLPGLSSSSNQSQEEILLSLEETIDESMTQDMVGLDLQNMIATDISGVYVVVPGHSFNL